MSYLHEPFTAWLLQSLAVGGLILLLAGWSFLFVRQPVRRRQIGVWAVRVALLAPILTLLPSWILLPRPVEKPAPMKMPQEQTAAAPPEISTQAKAHPEASIPVYYLPTPSTRADDSRTEAVVASKEPPSPAPLDRTAAAATDSPIQIPWRPAAQIIYFTAAGLFLLRFACGHWAVWRMLRRSAPANDRLQAILTAQLPAGRRSPRLLVSNVLPAPICCGLLRPAIVVPAALAQDGSDEKLRWVFAHELAHLERGDLHTGLWLALAQILYFPLPWFWWLRGQITLAQEFVADASAAAVTNRTDDYASFLLELSRRLALPRCRNAAATGVLGKPSDLYRRIAMLLNHPQGVERRCPRGWTMLAAGGFLAIALVLSGLGWQRTILADDPKEPKDEPAKKFDLPKPADAPKQPAEAPDPFDQMFENQLKNLDNIPAEIREQMKKQIEEARKRMKEMRARGFGMGNVAPLPLGPFAGGGANFNPFGNTEERSTPRLGASVEKPSQVLVEQLDLPKNQGLVIGDVGVGSAAAKAGLKPNDILLEINGKPVVSDPAEFRKQLNDVKANTPVDAVVMRKGRRENIKGISLPEAKAEEQNANPFQGAELPLRPGFNRIQVPNVPNFQPNIPNIPVPNFNNVFQGGNATSLSVSIANDQFTIDSNSNGLHINLTGKIDGDKAKVESIVIQDGSEKTSVDKLDRVPEKYREQVEKLLKRVEVQRR
ncbi:MAG TPA: M56 family metallopeptidase [Gemmataceae bacterium]|nr:M56 family metallopeptidase [Gemmataceae bacterium]